MVVDDGSGYDGGTVPPNPERRENREIPGGVQGGVIEQVKRAVMTALKQALMGTVLGRDNTPVDIDVNMEYPMEPETYPGIWVQFSFTEMMNSGIAMEMPWKEGDNWVTLREFQFKGTVTLTLMALSNLERDRLADAIVTMLMFARIPQHVLTKPNEDTKQFRSLIDSLANNPYIAMTIDHDQIQPGGQTMTPGVPWDEELAGYEDNYSFSILGQANIVFRRDGTYTLRAVDMNGELEPAPDPDGWQ